MVSLPLVPVVSNRKLLASRFTVATPVSVIVLPSLVVITAFPLPSSAMDSSAKFVTPSHLRSMRSVPSAKSVMVSFP